MIAIKTINMTGKTFNECWCIDNLTIHSNDRVIVLFANDSIIKVVVNGVKQWDNETD